MNRSNRSISHLFWIFSIGSLALLFWARPCLAGMVVIQELPPQGQPPQSVLGGAGALETAGLLNTAAGFETAQEIQDQHAIDELKEKLAHDKKKGKKEDKKDLAAAEEKAQADSDKAKVLTMLAGQALLGATAASAPPAQPVPAAVIFEAPSAPPPAGPLPH